MNENFFTVYNKNVISKEHDYTLDTITLFFIPW